MAAHPVTASDRIQSLDVLRGFALLGILLLNILGFGLHSAGYFNPLIGLGETETSRALNLGAWGSVSVLFEGAMRCLFSILFGAGVVLFTSGGRAKARSLHYRRNFWLLIFGVFDAYVLLWTGDILMVYAISGAILYLLRNLSPRTLLIIGAVLIVLIGAFYGVAAFALGQAQTAENAAWADFEADFTPTDEAYETELAERRGSYLTAFRFTTHHMVEILVLIYPVYLIPDALAMMILGMAFFKLGILDASRSTGWYTKLAVVGFGVGLLTNLYELRLAIAADYAPLATMPLIVPTYQVGRLGMALGYLGLIMIVCKLGSLPGVRRSLAAVGRMALTNYLMHSTICLVLFTGLAFGLVGVLERWQLYPIVFAIWAFQLWFSPWWLERHRFGPAEWLWRALTYGKRP
jgi:uncharacterized protein